MSHVRLGLSLEALLDPGWRFVQEAYVEEWVFVGDVPSEGPSSAEDPMDHDTDHSEFIPVTPLAAMHSSSFPLTPLEMTFFTL